MKTAQELKVGDTFTYRHRDVDYPVEVLIAPQPHEDITGLSVLKLYCKTGERRGWVILGPDAEVDVDDCRIMTWGLPNGDEVRGVVNLTKMEEWYVATGRGKNREDMSLEDIAEFIGVSPITYFED